MKELTFNIFLVSFVLFIGFISLLFFLKTLISSISSKKWPVVEGRMTISNVTQYRRKWNWQYAFQYVYKVENQELTSHRMYFGGMPSITVARNIRNRYPVNCPVKVRFNPKKPNVSVIISGINRYTFTGLYVFLVSVLMALGFTYLTWYK